MPPSNCHENCHESESNSHHVRDMLLLIQQSSWQNNSKKQAKNKQTGSYITKTEIISTHANHRITPFNISLINNLQL